MSMKLIEHLMMQLVSSLANIVELCAAFIIISACLRAFIGFLFKALFQRMPKEKIAEYSLRIELGFALSLALEFELGADILKTAIAPNWQAIGVVAVIIVLRTMLNYFLQKELDHEERKKNREEKI